MADEADAVARAARAMVPPAAAAALAVAADPPALLGGEWDAARRMAPRRLRTFAAGRACARQAMQSLGWPPHPLPVLPDRTPGWPVGLCGSISHTETCAVAVVAPSGLIRSLGIDLEARTPLDENLFARVLVESELARVREYEEPGIEAKKLFCAKEAVYKCTWPLTRQFLEFHDVIIGPRASDGHHAVSAPNRLPDVIASAIELQIREVAGVVLAVAVLRRDRDG